MKKIIACIILLGTISVQAQDIKNFTLTNIKDGKKVSLADYASAKAIVIVFTRHECPFDNYYKERIKGFVQAYSGSVQFLLINSNTEAEESKEQMAIHYTDVPVPYLADKDQVVMTSLGARKTPEVFLLKSAGGKFLLSYSGAIDDNPQEATDVRQHFLQDAIDQVLAGQKVEVSTQRPTGCTTRKN